MPYTGTPPLPVAANGEVIDGSDITTLINAVHGVTDAWTAFTPVWSSSGVAPAIGNGTIGGRYIQSGKLVIYRGQILWGSTTTGGTGTWTVTVPVTVLDGAQTAVAILIDASAGATRMPGAVAFSAGTMTFYAGTGGVANATAPFTWTTSDSLTWQITYEAA